MQLYIDYAARIYLGYSNYLHMVGAGGTVSFNVKTSSSKIIIKAAEELFEEIADENLMVRRVSLSFNEATTEDVVQYDLFTDPDELDKEKRLQRAALEIKKKFGKNAIIKGMNLEEAGTAMERNLQIGDHKSGAGVLSKKKKAKS